MKLKAGLERVVPVNLCKVILNHPTAALRTAAAAVAERLERNPIRPVEVYGGKTVWTYSLQSNLSRPISAQGDRELRHGDAIPAEANVIQGGWIDCPVFRRTNQPRHISLRVHTGQRVGYVLKEAARVRYVVRVPAVQIIAADSVFFIDNVINFCCALIKSSVPTIARRSK